MTRSPHQYAITETV